ncbi:MAG TPA: DUF4337 domain-containing protein [Bryobacteraceae bacterium]|jgi:hypothetical protein|nr:DUF4337 domain-containing protein [Bryobacteraceae bacterium]
MELSEELKEHAEEARGPFDRKVAVSMAIIAAALAIATVLGHIATTEELVNQQRAADQWAFYQAKAMRRYQSEIARDVLAAVGPAGAPKSREYAANVDRYQRESDQVQEKAREFERESERARRQAMRLHVGETLLEIAIVLASLAILTKRRMIWLSGIVTGAAGALAAATALLVA